MAVVPIFADEERPLTEREWEALVDPPGGRFEILESRLVVSPSPVGAHNRYAEDLADLLRDAIERAGLDLDVTTDVEWRTVAGDIVTNAPRGDVVVGRLDEIRDIHLRLPILVAEVWSAGTRPGVRRDRREYWQRVGLAHHWEIQLGADIHDTAIAVYDLASGLHPRHRLVGADRAELGDPVPLTLCPAEVYGWTARRLREARESVDEARAREEAALAAAEEALARALRAERERDQLARRASRPPDAAEP